jgi:predicted trehalose synthase
VNKEPDRKHLGEAFRYEELPASTVTKALAKRRDSVSRLYSPLNDKVETLESLGAILEEAKNVGRRVELVHSAYTRDIESVARIARWIAVKA